MPIKVRLSSSSREFATAPMGQRRSRLTRGGYRSGAKQKRPSQLEFPRDEVSDRHVRVSKTVVGGFVHRGFESHPLRFMGLIPCKSPAYDLVGISRLSGGYHRRRRGYGVCREVSRSRANRARSLRCDRASAAVSIGLVWLLVAATPAIAARHRRASTRRQRRRSRGSPPSPPPHRAAASPHACAAICGPTTVTSGIGCSAHPGGSTPAASAAMRAQWRSKPAGVQTST